MSTVNKEKKILNSSVMTFTMCLATEPKVGITIQPNLFPSKATEQPNRLKDVQFLEEQKFYDKEFPKTWASIYGFCGGDTVNDELRASLDWVKPNYIYKDGDYNIFSDNILDSDIEQGKLSDCYFLAAAASICENEDNIKRLIFPHTPNKEGCYSVFLNVFGCWEEVVIDHRLPVNKFTKKPLFNTSNRVVLWSMLLEKAYAKIHGGYANIAWGISRHAFTDLTGCAAENYMINVKNQKEIDQRFNDLKQAIKNKWPMSVLSKNQSGDGKDNIGNHGIVSNHYYSILDVQSLHAGEKTYKIIKLRNPWGSGKWKGAWSDNDRIWTDKLRESMNYFSKNDGCFYMSYDDFNKYYKAYQICYLHNNYTSSAFKLKQQNEQDYFFKFKINKPGLWYFMQHQINNKMYHPKERYAYSKIVQSIFRVDQNSVAHNVETVMKKDKQIFIQTNCPVGTYYIKITAFWESYANQCTFSAYGPEPIPIKRVTLNEIEPRWLHGLLYERALAPNPIYKDGKNGWIAMGKPGIRMKFEKGEDNFGYWLVENKSTDYMVKLEVDVLEHQNVMMMTPFVGNYNPSFKVYPQSSSFAAFIYSAPCILKQKFKAGFYRDNTVISEEFKKTAALVKRNYQNKEVDINLYVAYDNDTYSLGYENRTEDLILDEWIIFDLIGCHIDDESSSGLHIYLLPGKSRIVKIFKDRPFDPKHEQKKDCYKGKIHSEKDWAIDFDYNNPEKSDLDLLVFSFQSSCIIKDRFGCVWPPAINSLMTNVLNQKSLAAIEKSRKTSKLK